MNIRKQYITSLIAFAVVLLTANGCYKGDVNHLLSRQYDLAYNLKEIDKKADKINGEIANLTLIIKTLQDKKQVTSLVYDEKNGKRLGATLTIDGKEIYIPFGQNGRDGQAPKIEISKDGNWIINGVDSGKKAIGENAKTPKISAMKDPDKTDDDTLYWTVQYGDAAPSFILDKTGKKIQAKGDKGDPGIPGVKGDTGAAGTPGAKGDPGTNSPIVSIKKSEDGKKLIITTTIKDLETIEVPLDEKLKFVIKPEAVEVPHSVADASQSPPPHPYRKDLNILKFDRPDQVYEIPFEKTDDLTSVEATMPTGWKYQIDTERKKIQVKSPRLSNFPSAANYGQANFFARKSNGETYSQQINVLLPPQLCVNYFFNEDLKSYPTGDPRSPFNTLDLSASPTMVNVFSLFEPIDDKNYRANAILPIDNNNGKLPESMRKEVFLPIDLFEPAQGKLAYPLFFTTLSYIFDKSYFDLFQHGGENVPTLYAIQVNKFLPEEESNVILMSPVPWNTFYAFQHHTTSYATSIQTIRLRRATQMIKLDMKAPKKELGLGNEEFNPDNLTLKHVSSVLMLPDGKIQIIAAPNLYVTKFSNSNKVDDTSSITYDKTEDIVRASFATLPTGHTNFFKLLLEYKKEDGSIIKKMIKPHLPGYLPVPKAGGAILHYKINVHDPQFSTFPSLLSITYLEDKSEVKASIITEGDMTTPSESGVNMWLE